MNDTTAPTVEQQHMVRPVVHGDGRRGQCECRPRGYTITWEDGTTQDCVDTSYVGASFTDLNRVARLPLPPTPRAKSYGRGEARHLWANKVITDSHEN